MELVYLTCHPITPGINLWHSVPGPALILNANITPLLIKTPAANGASEKITHISGVSIFGGSATVQL